MQLGQYGEVATVAAGLIAGQLNKKKKSSSARRSSGALRPSTSSTPGITVSPAIQTKISPQISPVFSQIQDSAGASTYGAPTMTSSGGQYADTGADMPIPSGVPRGTSRKFSPFDEFGRPTSRYPDYGGMPVVSKMGGGYQDIIKWGVMGAIALFAIKSFQKPSYSTARPDPKTVSGTRLA